MSEDEKFANWLYALGVVVVGVIFLCMLPKWERGDQERSALASAGYTSVELKGFDFFGCPDLFGMKFEGKGPTGVHVQGVVCKGILTQASIRISN
ncbi:hypothetical protein A9R05_42295 (plasmid) [Burkholderia sp. KK1]|uniref:Uncharacterized protein n=1 Tax=Burkholderia sp. M701 TaxID=326454 RepID=V5YNC8_9BURK|nr:hypothetical protein [Burkholderia sp. M701]AQH05651.1 hypothetical protein A9R05_42295 [Burkholderia sp. KK1]BAO18907.1 hypothetical protein [Burkholderia sp. M701]